MFLGINSLCSATAGGATAGEMLFKGATAFTGAFSGAGTGAGAVTTAAVEGVAAAGAGAAAGSGGADGPPRINQKNAPKRSNRRKTTSSFRSVAVMRIEDKRASQRCQGGVLDLLSRRRRPE